MNTAVPLLCQVTGLLVSQLVPHCYSRACIECGANVGPSQFLRKPLSCHESWSKIPPPLPSGPKISSSNESIHVLIFSKRGDDQKVVSLTRGPCILTQTRRCVCDMSWPRDSQCSVCGGGDHHCTRGRSPDSLYAALLVIRSSVKLSIAKTRDIGWWGRVMPEIINSRVFTFPS